MKMGAFSKILYALVKISKTLPSHLFESLRKRRAFSNLIRNEQLGKLCTKIGTDRVHFLPKLNHRERSWVNFVPR